LQPSKPLRKNGSASDAWLPVLMPNAELPTAIMSFPAKPDLPWGQVLRRGLARHCPRCGKGRLFSGYIKQHAQCRCCGQDLIAFRADDAPAYFTILIVGHVVVPSMLALEIAYHPPTIVHLLLWLPTTLALTLLLLPPIKGLLIALQWKLWARR
jgi:uncharacterized protein (DUF983 family)